MFCNRECASPFERICRSQSPSAQTSLVRGIPWPYLSLNGGSGMQRTFKNVKAINAENIPRPKHGRQIPRYRPATQDAQVQLLHSTLSQSFVMSSGHGNTVSAKNTASHEACCQPAASACVVKQGTCMQRHEPDERLQPCNLLPRALQLVTWNRALHSDSPRTQRAPLLVGRILHILSAN